MTYKQESINNKLNLVIDDLGINDGDNSFIDINNNSYYNLTYRLKTNQDSVGYDFSNIATNKINKHLNDLLQKIKVDDYIFFTVFKSDKTDIVDKREQAINLINGRGSLLICRLNDGVFKSIFTGLRNALCHKNIILIRNKYFLYSKNNDKQINFVLKTDNLEVIDIFAGVFNELYHEKNNNQKHKKQKVKK